nr:conopeptide [Conus arenatus]
MATNLWITLSMLVMVVMATAVSDFTPFDEPNAGSAPQEVRSLPRDFPNCCHFPPLWKFCCP